MTVRELLGKLRDWLNRHRLSTELDDELRFHQEQLIRDGGALGARRLGNLTRLREDTRDTWSFRWLDQLGQDTRHAVRSFRRTPGFTTAAVLTLALGVGATTAILSIVNGVLIRPLPYPNADRAVLVWSTDPRTPGTDLPHSLPNLLDVRRDNRTLERLAGFHSWNFILTDAGEPEQLAGAKVMADLFGILGVKPALGRTFVAQDEEAEGSVVISDRLWRSRFGADPAIVGRSIRLNGASTTIVGVMPPGFHFPRGAELPVWARFGRRTDVWAPLVATQHALESRGLLNLTAIGLPKAGIDPETVSADLALTMRAITQQYPALNPGASLKADPILATAVAPVRPALLVLLGAVAFLLLIACVNVSSLLLTRAEGRRREIAVRVAIGAGKARLTRQFLTENIALTAIGGGLGALIAILTRHALLALAPVDLPRVDDISIDWRLLTSITGLVIAIGVALGALVANASRDMDQEGLLRDGARGSAGRGRQRTRSGLVILQVAVSVVLLAGATLLGQTLYHLQRLNPGFDPAQLLTAKAVLPAQSVRGQFYQQALDELSARPGVVDAAAATALPLGGVGESTSFTIAGRAPLEPGQQQLVLYNGVSAGYFETLRIPLVRGRSFGASDLDSSAATVIISDALARAHWPDQDPLGARIDGLFGRSYEVVGVVGDVRHRDMLTPAAPMLYFPLSVHSSGAMTLVVRSEFDEGTTATLVRDVIRKLDPAAPVTDVVPMHEILSESVAQQRFSATLLGSFGIAAVALAVLGLYGVISFGVAQRVKELGIRLALGAAPTAVYRLVVREGMTLAGLGIVLGLIVSGLLGRVLTNLVYGVSPTDPATLAGVSVLLLLVGAVATVIPARRAARVDVVAALHDNA